MAAILPIQHPDAVDENTSWTCGECQKRFTSPKVLPCSHFYCKECLGIKNNNSAQLIRCPECKLSSLPANTNFFMPVFKHDQQVVTKGKAIPPACDNCDIKYGVKHFKYTSRPFQMCQSCVKSHENVLKIHGFLSLEALNDLEELNEHKGDSRTQTQELQQHAMQQSSQLGHSVLRERLIRPLSGTSRDSGFGEPSNEERYMKDSLPGLCTGEATQLVRKITDQVELAVDRPWNTSTKTNGAENENQQDTSVSKLIEKFQNLGSTNAEENVRDDKPGIYSTMSKFNVFSETCDVGDPYYKDNFAGSVFDSRGGYLKMQSSDVVLYIPPCAIEEGQKQRVYCHIDDNSYGRIHPERTVLTSVVKCGPDGTTFKNDVVLRVPHCAVHAESWQFTSLIKEGNKNWKELPEDAVIITRTHIFFFLRHFTRCKAEGKAKKGCVAQQRINIGVQGNFCGRKHCKIKICAWKDMHGGRDKESSVNQKTNWLECKPIIVGTEDTKLTFGFNDIHKGWKLWGSIPFKPILLEDIGLGLEYDPVPANCQFIIEYGTPEDDSCGAAADPDPIVCCSVSLELDTSKRNDDITFVIEKETNMNQPASLIQRSKDMTNEEFYRSWNEESIPHSHQMTQQGWCKLCEILNVERDGLSDWKGFAGQLQLNSSQIKNAERKENRTCHFLSFFFANEAGLQMKLVESLKKLESIFADMRNDMAVDIIREEIKIAHAETYRKDSDEPTIKPHGTVSTHRSGNEADSSAYPGISEVRLVETSTKADEGQHNLQIEHQNGCQRTPEQLKFQKLQEIYDEKMKKSKVPCKEQSCNSSDDNLFMHVKNLGLPNCNTEHCQPTDEDGHKNEQTGESESVTESMAHHKIPTDNKTRSLPRLDNLRSLEREERHGDKLSSNLISFQGSPAPIFGSISRRRAWSERSLSETGDDFSSQIGADSLIEQVNREERSEMDSNEQSKHKAQSHVAGPNRNSCASQNGKMPTVNMRQSNILQDQGIIQQSITSTLSNATKLSGVSSEHFPKPIMKSLPVSERETGTQSTLDMNHALQIPVGEEPYSTNTISDQIDGQPSAAQSLNRKEKHILHLPETFEDSDSEKQNGEERQVHEPPLKNPLEINPETKQEEGQPKQQQRDYQEHVENVTVSQRKKLFESFSK